MAAESSTISTSNIQVLPRDAYRVAGGNSSGLMHRGGSMELQKAQNLLNRRLGLIGTENVTGPRKHHQMRAWDVIRENPRVLGRYELIGFAVNNQRWHAYGSEPVERTPVQYACHLGQISGRGRIRMPANREGLFNAGSRCGAIVDIGANR